MPHLFSLELQPTGDDMMTKHHHRLPVGAEHYRLAGRSLLPVTGVQGGKALSAAAAGAAAIGALAVGSLAIGALSVGVLALGRMVVGKILVRRARLGRLEIGTLSVDKLELAEPHERQGDAPVMKV